MILCFKFNLPFVLISFMVLESTVLSTGKVGSYQLTTVNPNITYLWIISPVTDVDSSGS